MNTKKLIKTLQVKEKHLAKLRDELRELRYEVTEREENIEAALDDLGRVIDTLSELV
jgi:uncharacterized protein YdcH (DUF465 family)